MSNANRDYAIVYDVKNGLIVLSRPLIFYITDKNTSNIFVKLVTRVNVGNGIDQYTDIENASNYVLTMRVIKPNNEVKSLEATQHEEESIFQFDLTEDFKDIPGKCICELTISTIVNSRQELITSDPFSYEVKRSILSNVSEIIETEDTTVEKLLNDLETTKAEMSSQIKDKVNISAFNSKVWSMSNMGQDVKEAMTGRSVAVVGKDAVLTENIVDRQVTRGKTTCYSVWRDGNLLSKEINTKQYGYIYLDNGTRIDDSAYTLKLTLEDIDFINIPLRFNFTSYITYWDEGDTFISGYIQSSLDNGENTELLKNMPSNAKYILMSIWVRQISTAIIAKDSTYSSVLETKYIDDHLLILNDNLDKNIKFTKHSLEDIELYPFGNLIDKNKLIYGKWWNTNGEPETTADCTFEFEIDPTEQYRFNFTSHITYWDENYEFISGYIQGSLDNGINTELLTNIPSNAKYVRMLLYASRVNDAIFALNSAYSRDLKCTYYMKNFTASDENLNNKQNKNPLYGKKAIFFGDSWCDGNTSQPGGWAGWIKANNPSMTITNCGRHGADWFQCYNTWFNDKANYNSLDDEADYIIIEAYTNGLYVDVDQVAKPLGEVDEFTYYNSVDEIIALGNTYAVDLEKVLYSIVTKWNGKKIGLMFPYKSVDMLRQNNAFRKFREQVFKCCRKYNIAVFDNFDSCNIPSWTQEYIDKYFFHGDDNQEHGDRVHLNNLGYSIICPRIENWLKTL